MHVVAHNKYKLHFETLKSLGIRECMMQTLF